MAHTTLHRTARQVWNDVSALAKDLICKLLTVNPRDRLTCKQCLAHAWFSAELEEKELRGAQQRLRKMCKRKFKGAVEAVIAVNRMKHALLFMGGAGANTQRKLQVAEEHAARSAAAGDGEAPLPAGLEGLDRYASTAFAEADPDAFPDSSTVRHAEAEAAEYVVLPGGGAAPSPGGAQASRGR